MLKPHLFFIDSKVKSDIVGKEIASRIRKWYWMLFSVKFKARYGGLKIGGKIIVAILYLSVSISR